MPSFNRKPKKKAVQFNNKASTCNYGHSHRSKLEGAVCDIIWFREKAGEIKLIQVEATVYLTDARYKYIPDFKCINIKSGEEFFVEAKGFPNQRWPTTKKLWKFYGPGELHIYKGSYMAPVLSEIIIPRIT